jgi:3-phosphoshikimate 1-carboxyvinyltransferase
MNSSSQLTIATASCAQGTCDLPGSKSISNRALLLSALCAQSTDLLGLLDADDVRYMREALQTLGVSLQHLESSDWRVCGAGGAFPNQRANLFLGNAGTAVRPLTAVLAMLGGDYRLDGVSRMHERPIGDLVDALRMLGAQIQYLDKEGFLPLTIGARDKRVQVGNVDIRGDVSSQFLSALLMALPLLPKTDGIEETSVHLITPLISRPYVMMTIHLMARFGVHVAIPDEDHLIVPRGVAYQSPGTLVVESDASSASYFLAAGVLGGGPVRVNGVGKHSIQGDIAFAGVLRRQGAQVHMGEHFVEAKRGTPFIGGEIDCVAIPDAAMTLAITALIAQQPTTLRNIGSWRVKETDRIAAMATELKKVGAQVESGEDWLTIFPTKNFHHAAIDTYDDHRMAMCFSLLALLGTGITINHPECVAKTFPDYFDVFQSLLLRPTS